MADIYHIFADHNADVNAMEFTTKMRKFLDQMVAMKRMNSYRLTRAKLGFRSMNLPEFHIMMEFDNMQQLDDAMTITDTGLVEFNTGFNVGSDASGDILYHNGTKYVRLAKGTDGQSLVLSSGIPAWVTTSTTLSAETLNLTLNDDSNATGPILNFTRNTASPANNDYIMNIRATSKDSGGNDTEYGRIAVLISDPADGNEDGAMQFYSLKAGSLSAWLTHTGGGSNTSITTTTTTTDD